MLVHLRPAHLSRRLPRHALRRSLSAAAECAAPHEDFDVVIVGGGPVGLALASAFGSSRAIRENLRIALVEAGDLDKTRNWKLHPGKYSNRVSSLTNASYAFLKDIGAWHYVQAGRTCPIERMQVWDGISDARVNFDAAEMGAGFQHEGMAHLTENLNLQQALLLCLEKAPAINLIHQTKVTSVTRDSEDYGAWPIVNLDIGRRLRARLLIGADGFNSPVRAYARIPSFGWSYDTRGIVATLVHHTRSAYDGPNTTAYQRFLPTGPIAFLPLAPSTSSLVWSIKPEIAGALQACDTAVLASMVNAAFRLPHLTLQYLYSQILEAHASGTPMSVHRLHEEISWREKSHGIDPHSALSSVTATSSTGVPPVDSVLVPPRVTSIQDGSVASFPLRLSHTEAYIGEGAGARTVLVGDAAHTIHPLAGQGLNLGLGDIECLTKCIEESILRGGDIGSFTALQPYARERYPINHTMMAVVDKLHKLYSTDFEPVVWARSVGLEVVNELDSLKAAIMMTAGADTRKFGATSSWDMMAKGLDTLSGAGKVMRAVGGIEGLISAGVRTLTSRVMGDRRV